MRVYDSQGFPLVSGGGGGGGVALSAGTQSVSTGTVVLSNSNNISFGMSGSSRITASFDAVLSAGVSTLGNTSGDTRVGGGQIVFQGGQNITLSQITAPGNLNTIFISGGTLGAGTIEASWDFDNSTVAADPGNQDFRLNNATLGSVTEIYLNDNSNQNFDISTIMAFMLAGYRIYIQQKNDATRAALFALTGVPVDNGGWYTIPVSVVADSGLLYQNNAECAFAFVLAVNSISGMGISAGTQSVSTGTVILSNSNNVSFGMSGSSVVTASASFPAQTDQTLGLYAVGNTTGQSSSSTFDARTASLVGQGIVSLGFSNGSVNVSATQSGQAASGQNGSFAFQTLGFSNANGVSFGTSAGSSITASVAAQTVQPGIQSVSAGTTRVTTGEVVFSNSNGVSFGVNGQTVTASHNGLTSQSNQAFSAAGGSSAFQTLSFSDNAAGSFTNTNGQLALASVRASLFAVSNTTQSSSGTQNLNALSFAGAGIASVGITNGSIVLSVPTGAPSPVNFSAGTTSNNLGSVVFSNSNGVSFGLNGSTITASVGAAAGHTYSGFNPYPDLLKIGGQYGQGSLQFDPVRIPNVQFDRAVIPLINTNSSNSSGSHTLSFWVGLYSRNVSSLSLVQSVSSTTALTHSGTAGSYSLYSGNRLFTIPMTTTLTEGDYWLGFVSRTTSAAANGTYSNLVASNLASNFLGHFGSSHNTTYQLTLGQGVYTATTSGMPGSVAFSQIRGSDSLARRAAFIMFASGTVP